MTPYNTKWPPTFYCLNNLKLLTKTNEYIKRTGNARLGTTFAASIFRLRKGNQKILHPQQFGEGFIGRLYVSKPGSLRWVFYVKRRLG